MRDKMIKLKSGREITAEEWASYTPLNAHAKKLKMYFEKKLVCDMCGTAGDEENEVWEWGNPYDNGTICEECQETVNDSR